jgi:cytochrome P450
MKIVPNYDCDFYSDNFIKNPFQHYAEMRALGPVVYIPKLNNYAITQYNALKEALINYNSLVSGLGIASDEIGCKFVKGQIVSSDPPVHKVMRKAMLPPLMPQALKQVIPDIKKASDKLINELIIKEEFDSVSDLAQYLPLSIVRDLVGLPDFGKENMLKWAAASFNVLGIQNERGRKGAQEIIELRKFISGELHLNNVKAKSWIERILKMIDTGSLEETLGNRLIRDYINPSLDTTISAISHLIYLLSKNNFEWRKLQQNPKLLKNTVNEAIRLGSPIRSFSRIAIKNLEIEEYIIPKNSRVMMVFASANRDEKVYENPNKFSINRNFKEHLGFGHGIHSCVGMHLAQIEMISLLEAMLPLVKKIETKEPEIALNNTIYGFSKLPTKFIPIS